MNNFNPRIANSNAKPQSGIGALLKSSSGTNSDMHDGNPLSRIINIDGIEIKLYRKSFSGEVNADSSKSDIELFTFPAKENPRASEHLTEESLSHIQNIEIVQLYSAIAYLVSDDGVNKYAIVDGISRRQKAIYVGAQFHIEYSPTTLTLKQAKKIVEMSEQRTSISPWEKGCYHHKLLENTGSKQVEHAKLNSISTGELSRILNLYRTHDGIVNLFIIPTAIRKKADVEFIGSIEKKLHEKNIDISDFLSECQKQLSKLSREGLDINEDTSLVIREIKNILKSASNSISKEKEKEKPKTLYSSNHKKITIENKSKNQTVIKLIKVDNERKMLIEEFISLLDSDDLTKVKGILNIQ